MPDLPAQDEEFFVGYLRTPLRLVRFLTVLVIVLLLAVDGAALLLYRIQEARPSGDWGTEGEVAFDGILVARPYPFVLVPATAQSAAHAVILVSEGKEGAPAETRALDGKHVSVQGYPLLRDGLTVLQLSRLPRALPDAADASGTAPIDAGMKTLSGEIADSKCFLGAMNPGEGKVHAECASLCILGDIPPLFVTRDAAGRVSYRLLADEAGGPLSEAASSRAGEYLTLSGRVTRLPGIEIFAVHRAALD